MSDINWQMGTPPRNGNYLVETKDDFAIDYWFEHTWDDNGSNVIAWLPIEGDRVEVVRCQDCKHYMDLGFTTCRYLRVTCNDDDFCSKGERKEVEE